MNDPSRIIKDRLYAQVARMGKAISSPKRLELIEILCQGEKTVEQLAADAQISVKLASAHLKELRQAQLAETRRDGKYIHYRLASLAVGDFWVALRALAEDRLVELQLALAQLAEHSEELSPLAPGELLQRAARGEVVVIDVRPREEYDTGHLPHAQSLPLNELRSRIKELPRDKPVVAYCRGPFCLWGKDAVALLRGQGIEARRLQGGVPEWRAAGLPVETINE
ncbi:MAG: metalloregulator ArsR/SmtB family transcription factor [Thiobacillaceae bacterium]|jgi:rhodanese-related sulfurtransferase|nr:metalloregulator ArsR/SmtB family transcription factor [Thiobacillaceae bacterium]